MPDILSLDAIRSLLDTERLIDEIEAGFVLYSGGRVTVPPVGFLHFDKPPGDVHIKYGSIADDDYWVPKVASGFYENPKLGLAPSDGVILVFNQRTGALELVLHDRCWLRLSRIRLDQLQRWLPPDGGGDAPELIRYRELLSTGDSPLQAQQRCWLEFGTEDCQRALKGFWVSQDTCRHGWTTTRYLDLLSRYREMFEAGDTAVPMLVLARAGSRERHKLCWVSDSTPTMRHTCA